MTTYRACTHCGGTGVDPVTQEEHVAQLAEVIHAEHHPGTFVPDLDSCPEHTRAEYEQLVRGLS